MSTDIKEQARLLKNEYQREWRRKNPERAREHQKSYWERQAIKQLKENRDI